MPENQTAEPGRKLDMILAKDAGGEFQLWACRGEGKGCRRNKFRQRAVPCDDCKGPLAQHLTLEEVERQLEQGDA